MFLFTTCLYLFKYNFCLFFQTSLILHCIFIVLFVYNSDFYMFFVFVFFTIFFTSIYVLYVSFFFLSFFLILFVLFYTEFYLFLTPYYPSRLATPLGLALWSTRSPKTLPRPSYSWTTSRCSTNASRCPTHDLRERTSRRPTCTFRISPGECVRVSQTPQNVSVRFGTLEIASCWCVPRSNLYFVG